MTKKEFARNCTECGAGMNEGYCFDGGRAYYCSDACLHKHFTHDEWKKLYADGEGDSYWTRWEDEDEDDESDLYPYIVLYRDPGMTALDAPLVFKCEADDALHAIEQCENGNPGAIVLWSHQSDDVQEV